MESKLILATGVFDILHPGHLHYLNESKKLGDKLFVIVAHDKTVLKRKGREAVFSQSERVDLVQNLKMVDKAVAGQEDNFIQTAIDLNPDIITLGWDQKIDEEKIKDEFKNAGIDIEFVRIQRLDEHSSGSIRERVLKNQG